jgi:hypothetical protein
MPFPLILLFPTSHRELRTVYFIVTAVTCVTLSLATPCCTDGRLRFRDGRDSCDAVIHAFTILITRSPLPGLR